MTGIVRVSVSLGVLLRKKLKNPECRLSLSTTGVFGATDDTVGLVIEGLVIEGLDSSEANESRFVLARIFLYASYRS